MELKDVIVGEEIACTIADEKDVLGTNNAYSTLVYVCTGQDD